MLLISRRLIDCMFKCMDNNNNKYPNWIDERFKEVYNPF